MLVLGLLSGLLVSMPCVRQADRATLCTAGFFVSYLAQDHVFIADHSQHMPCHSGPGLWWWQDREANAEGWQGVPQVQGQEEFMAQGKHGFLEDQPAATAYHCPAGYAMQHVRASFYDIGLGFGKQVFWSKSPSEVILQSHSG